MDQEFNATLCYILNLKPGLHQTMFKKTGGGEEKSGNLAKVVKVVLELLGFEGLFCGLRASSLPGTRSLPTLASPPPPTPPPHAGQLLAPIGQHPELICIHSFRCQLFSSSVGDHSQSTAGCHSLSFMSFLNFFILFPVCSRIQAQGMQKPVSSRQIKLGAIQERKASW